MALVVPRWSPPLNLVRIRVGATILNSRLTSRFSALWGCSLVAISVMVGRRFGRRAILGGCRGTSKGLDAVNYALNPDRHRFCTRTSGRGVPPADAMKPVTPILQPLYSGTLSPITSHRHESAFLYTPRKPPAAPRPPGGGDRAQRRGDRLPHRFRLRHRLPPGRQGGAGSHSPDPPPRQAP